MKKLITTTVLSLFLAGCTLPARVATKLVSRDLVRTKEMAETHGLPATAQCTTYLVEALEGRESLLSEDVDGLISLALKAYLLKNISQDAEAKFVKECGELAAKLLLEVGRAVRR